ncbi:MAG: hypothetical protein ACLU3U_13515 [Gallintestinimicrobium sp.]
MSQRVKMAGQTKVEEDYWFSEQFVEDMKLFEGLVADEGCWTRSIALSTTDAVRAVRYPRSVS